MLASSQYSLTSIRRDAWVEVDLDAIEQNIQTILSWLTPKTTLMAVVKSDAYGHGAIGISSILQASGATSFGVASVDEGCQLRDSSIKTPILILSPCPTWAISAAIQANLSLTITEPNEIKEINKIASQLNKQASVHLKFDSGMHRIGLSKQNLKSSIDALTASNNLEFAGFFSHLSCPDDADQTALQNNQFQEALKIVNSASQKPKLIHLASGEAARRFPDTHYDMVRVGLYMYGLEPQVVSDVVRPALSLRGRINHLQELPAGESVGYGLTWTSARPTRLASIPIGYADGVDRALSNKINGLLMKKKIQQVGRISMDQMLFDVTDVPEAQLGDVITLIGSENGASKKTNSDTLYIANWATQLNTITYELVCRLRVRLPKIYTRNNSPFKT